MKVLISGGAKSGKSSIAQELAVRLGRNGERYYIATMIPVDAEDHLRICRHIEERDGMGFATIEQGRHILSCLNDENRDGTFLLDSVTALLTNEMYRGERNFEPDLAAAHRCRGDLVKFAERAGNAVFVSDDIFSDAGRYDATTELFRRQLARIHCELARVCDTVIEVCAGSCVIHKGEMPE